MKSSFGFRTLSRAEAELEQCVAALNAAGLPAALRCQAVPPGYVAFEAESSGRPHEGWIDVAHVLRCLYPGVDDLAWQSVDPYFLLDLMAGKQAFAALPAPDGGWERVRPVAVIDAALAPQPLICFDGDAPVYFRSFPRPQQPVRPGQNTLCEVVSVTLSFRLGTSRMPSRMLSAISAGDALLINHAQQTATVGGKPYCRFHFQLQGGHIMLEPSDQWDDDLTPGDDGDYAVVSEDTPHDDERFTIDDLPVRLEFVLHEATMRFMDLSQLHAGAVLTMQADAASNVKIRANGRLVATGQLIQVGEHLAVQVRSVQLASKR